MQDANGKEETKMDRCKGETKLKTLICLSQMDWIIFMHDFWNKQQNPRNSNVNLLKQSYQGDVNLPICT